MRRRDCKIFTDNKEIAKKVRYFASICYLPVFKE